MTKKVRLVSFDGVDKSIEGIISGYCHLLKSKLKELWVIDRFGSKTDVIFSSEGQINKKPNDNTKIYIVIGEDLNHNSDKENVFNLKLPLSSKKIIETLNSISASTQSKEINSIDTEGFSLKNIFSRFLKKGKDKGGAHAKENREKFSSANKLLKMVDPNLKESLKIVFLGRPGSGKTTAISSLESDTFLSSDVQATDSVGLLKSNTTIGIDYTEYETDKYKLRIYGTPGQKRYNYVQEQTVSRADIYIILVDLSSVAPYAEFVYYKDLVESTGNPNAIKIVAFTHFDVKENDMFQLSKEIRRKCNGELLTMRLDPRNKDEVTSLLQKAAETRTNKDIDLSQVYHDNPYFLRNINA